MQEEGHDWRVGKQCWGQERVRGKKVDCVAGLLP
jgi:hypothetical protein